MGFVCERTSEVAKREGNEDAERSDTDNSHLPLPLLMKSVPTGLSHEYTREEE